MVLPAPLGPVTATTSPGRTSNETVSRRHDRPAGLLHAHPLDHEPRDRRRRRDPRPPGDRGVRGVDDRERRRGGREALLAGMELGAQPAQRQVRLRARARGRTARSRAPCPRRPAADRCRPPPAQPTAWPAAPGPARTGRRSAASTWSRAGSVRDPAQDLDLRPGPAVGAQRGQARNDVREPVREPAQRGPSPPPVGIRHAARSAP